MSLYNGPARGGNRGGKDQFNWDSVKSDKDREFYLGHSVKATTGRWQKGQTSSLLVSHFRCRGMLLLLQSQQAFFSGCCRERCVLVHT